MNFKLMAKTVVTLVLVLLMTSVTLMEMPIQPVQAQLSATQPSVSIPAGVTPNGTLTTEAFLSARPTRLGLGQVFLVNVWITPASGAMRRLLGFKITITKPDGTKDVITMDSESDTGATWFEYIADQIGTWKLKFEFPGTYLPAGRYYYGYIVTNASGTLYTGSSYYKPASTPEQTITVHSDIVYAWPEGPLPTDYWTRPVSHMLREWLPIIGDYPWHGPGGGGDWETRYPNTNPYWSPRCDFFPYVQGPNSAHIVWKRLDALAGIIGGGRYAVYGDWGWRYEVPHGTLVASPPVLPMIVAGRGYMTVTKVMPQTVNGTVRNLPTSVWQCFDIRTGEVYWEITGYPTMSNTLRSFGSWIFEGSIEYPSGTIVWITGGRLLKFSPHTGAVTVNVSISPLTTGIQYRNGYALSVQDLGAAAGALRYRLINWTTTGTTDNMTARIVSNITWPLSSLPATTDYNVGIAASASRGLPSTAGPAAEFTFTTIELATGRVLVNETKAAENVGYSAACDIADHGLYARLHTFGYFEAFDLRTGRLVWKSERMDYPWDAPAFGAYDTTSALGMFFRAAYSGVYAFDWKTGKIVWKYKAPADSPYETPYIDEKGQPVYSFNGVAQFADGKIYTINTEHTPTQPITRGWKLHCINATTGEGIWSIRITGSMGAIADGYMAVSDSYDGYMYVFGKGKSKTTVTAPKTSVPKGTAITIEGTVLDMSPAQPGTPCVSKESMATWMEHLHKQLPLSGIWGNETITGVPVSLCAIDLKGNVIDIGTVTTNGYYGTFGMAWTPPEEGTYEIIASFAGDDSYGSSAASTFVTVGPAPEPYPEPIQPEPPPDMAPLFYAIIAAAIAIIIAVAIATILILRKKP